MLNIIVVSDDLAADIGENCRMSCAHLHAQVDLTSHNVKILNGERCQACDVETEISSFNQQAFILVAYSHGTANALFSSVTQTGYVTLTNAYYFGKSLIYTNSCLSALELKDALVHEKCYGYVGYDGEVELPDSIIDEEIFITCENKALVHFLNTDSSLTESVEVMRNHYRTQFNEYIEQDMFVTAGSLFRNLGHLVAYDSQELMRSHLEN